MSIKLKIIVAREILILTTSIIIIALFPSYYSFLNYQISNEIKLNESIIHQKNEEINIKSLAYLNKLENQKLITKKIIKSFDKTANALGQNHEIWTILELMAKSIDTLKDKKANQIVDEFQEMLNVSTREEFKKLIFSNLVSIQELNSYHSVDRDRDYVKSLVWANYQLAGKKIKPKEIKDITFKFSFYFLIIVFGVRYCFYLIRWSIVTLNEKDTQ